MRLNFARHMPLLLIPVLLPAIIWPASATTDTTPPVWPSGSRITALSITSSSIYISWTPATDDSGTVNYKVYEDGAWNGMYTMSTSYGHQYLAPNTTIAFQITAVDPSNNLSPGPSATFNTAPAECQGYETCLTSLFTYTTTSTPGGTITVNDTLTNEGQDSIRITSITVAADQVVYSLTSGTQLLLRVGESGTRGLVIGVPQDETMPASQQAFYNNISISGGPAPVRAYAEELLPDILEGRIEPGRVFDRVIGLDDVPDGYRAMNDREAIKVMVTP